MTTIQNSLRRFSSLLRITMAAALLLASLALAPSAQATLFTSHTDPDITAQYLVVGNTQDSFIAMGMGIGMGFFTLNASGTIFDQNYITAFYNLGYDKHTNTGNLTLFSGTMLDLNMNPVGPASLMVNLTMYDDNNGDSQFLGNITYLDPLLAAAGFDASKLFGIQFSDMHNGFFQSDNFNINTPVPEPSTIILLGAGLLGIVAASRRKRQ